MRLKRGLAKDDEVVIVVIPGAFDDRHRRVVEARVAANALYGFRWVAPGSHAYGPAVRYADEGVTWARGWSGEAADTLRALEALA